MTQVLDAPGAADAERPEPHDFRDGLLRTHRDEILIASAIDSDVMRERGYQSIGRPTRNDNRPREQLRALGIPGWAVAEDSYFPGLGIPLWDAAGRRTSYQWKPRIAVPNQDGKRMKYAAPKGRAAVLDVHPRWTADRGREDPALVPYIRDVTRPLFITEGVKKADSMTSRGWCTVALSGVFNWRSSLGTLGDWEDVPLKGREVTIVFDADTLTNPNVTRAMQRLGRWVRDVKGAAEVWYLITPAEFRGQPTKGADDYFAAGGTAPMLLFHRTKTPPEIVNTSDAFSDARMAETVADDALADAYVWNRGMGWLGWSGTRWVDASDESVIDFIRRYSLDRFAGAAEDLKSGVRGAGDAVDGWRGMLSASRMKAIAGLTRGIVETPVDRFDADPAAFNTRNGLLALDSGIVRACEPADYVTKIAGAAFRADARSKLWDSFIETILPDVEVRRFVQRILGYSMLGVVREHILPIFVGDGANGKGTLRDTVIAAFGDYAAEVGPEILMAGNHTRHLTFFMELRGRRLVFCSETERSSRFAESTMKRLVGGDPIQANKMHKDPITFLPSHTLIMCTNHLPQVSGDDEAVWRRIYAVPFTVVIPEKKRDGKLSGKLSEPHVLVAVLAWTYAGYLEYEEIGLAPPDAVKARTADYRHESDLVGRFLDDRVVFGDNCSETSNALYTAYEAYARGEGEPLNKTAFGKEMTRRGHKSEKIGGISAYPGLMLNKPERETKPDREPFDWNQPEPPERGQP